MVQTSDVYSENIVANNLFISDDPDTWTYGRYIWTFNQREKRATWTLVISVCVYDANFNDMNTTSAQYLHPHI